MYLFIPQSDEEEGDEGVGSDVDKSYEVQFSMSPEPPEQEEEGTTTAEGKIQCVRVRLKLSPDMIMMK